MSGASDAVRTPPLSDLTLAEFECNTTGGIWNELLVLSRQPGVINLGQGFPDYDGSKAARTAAAETMTDPSKTALNQYSLPPGLKSLQSAVSTYYNKCYGLQEGATNRAIGPENVLVTVGATEGLYISLKALAGPGDEVLIFNPGFPWYLSTARMVGATPVLVELAGPDFAPDLDKLEKAITPKTKVLLINTPHNPCGHCYTKEELEGFARLALKYNLFVISDEVYENVTFGEARHLRIADEQGMFERTVTLCSASKLFSLTGWRVGWALSTPELLRGLAVYHCNTSYCAPSPLQHGLAVALGVEDGSFEASSCFGIPELVEGNAELLGNALTEKGFLVTRPQARKRSPAAGGHFLVADTTPLGFKGLECAKFLLTHAKVGVVPGVIFYFPDSTGTDPDRPLLRFAICKRRGTIEEAVRRIREMDLPAPK
ncbi:unnamed protein product [Ectocarpus sp. 6 AP-2014]